MPSSSAAIILKAVTVPQPWSCRVNAAANGAALGYAHIHTGVVRLGRIEAVYMTAQADAHTALVALVLSVELSDLLLAVLPVKLLTAQFQYLTALEVAQVQAGGQLDVALMDDILQTQLDGVDAQLAGLPDSCRARS